MTTPRLHVDSVLGVGAVLELEGPRVHYLAHVLRLRPGATLHLFNARDGEFTARIARMGRHDASLEIGSMIRAARPEQGPVLVFAPIRQNRMDWLVEKACELGVAGLQPVLTTHTVVKLAKPERLRAIACEAAEQSGRLSVPSIEMPIALAQALDARERKPLYFADEAGAAEPLAAAIAKAGPGDLLIGPEGGFSSAERSAIRASSSVLPVSLGRRILRAETAALHGLSVLDALAYS